MVEHGAAIDRSQVREEGREGTTAFVEKRKPAWVTKAE